MSEINSAHLSAIASLSHPTAPLRGRALKARASWSDRYDNLSSSVLLRGPLRLQFVTGRMLLGLLIECFRCLFERKRVRHFDLDGARLEMFIQPF